GISWFDETLKGNPRRQILGMVRQRQQSAADNQNQTCQHTETQQVADQQLHLAHLLFDCRFGSRLMSMPLVHPRNPFSNISPETQNKTATKTSRIVVPCKRPSKRDPTTAPISTPVATGATIIGLMSPRTK